jgi:hypothetical protein
MELLSCLFVLLIGAGVVMFLIKGLQRLFGKKPDVRESVDLVVEVTPRADRSGTLARVRVSGAPYRDYAIPEPP